ncbi:hypothetical protein IQ273_29660 [Nodosilinea sp. LEGE 07298]|nr:hypothetical protein [Nodosilinea sp. LEGE 07298]
MPNLLAFFSNRCIVIPGEPQLVRSFSLSIEASLVQSISNYQSIDDAYIAVKLRKCSKPTYKQFQLALNCLNADSRLNL